MSDTFIIALAGFCLGTLIGWQAKPSVVIERQSECVPASVKEVASLSVSRSGTLVCVVRPVKGMGEA